MPNPYGTSMTILNPGEFFGRHEALDYLFSEVCAHRCVSIIGTRRIGKSSLLRAMCNPTIQARFAPLYDLQKFLLIFIDLGEFLSKSCDDFFMAVCEQIVQQSAGRLHLTPPDDESREDQFWMLLDQVRKQEFHTVLLFDAFHKITSNTNFDPKFFSFMRAQANHGRVSYITASITTLDKCCHPYIEGSPFFNIFIPYYLGPLTGDEARCLITQPAMQVGQPFTPEEVTELLYLAGRHPFFIHRAAHFMFKDRTLYHARRQKFRSEVYRDLLPHFQDIWEHSLEYNQREWLKEESQWRSVAQRRVPELSEGILFLKFVRDTCHLKPVDITVEALEEVLEHFNNTKKLAESELTNLYLFVARLPPNSTIPRTASEKAITLRKILHEARDKLRPEGTHSETAPEWQFYNILNYRYFLGRMRNDLLAERLSISIRQLHRERKLAIEALRDVLDKMEGDARQELDML